MRILRSFWGFLFGIILIGGLPMSVIGLCTIVFDFIQKYSGISLGIWAGSALAILSIIFAVLALAGVIRYRMRQRKIPSSFFPLELILGLALGGYIFMWLGIITYASIG